MDKWNFVFVILGELIYASSLPELHNWSTARVFLYFYLWTMINLKFINAWLEGDK